MYIGLSPEEMVDIFDRMYLEVWEKTRDNVNWEAAGISKRLQEGQEVEISEFLLRLLEVVVTAARDGAILAIYHNNVRVAEDLRKIGIQVPPPQPGGFSSG